MILIKDVELYDVDSSSTKDRLFDVRIRDSKIDGIAKTLIPQDGEMVVDGNGGLLLPGLHDHHIHLASLAAALDSLQCGPPSLSTAAELGEQLSEQNPVEGSGWLRGIGYHSSVAGSIDRHWLDQYIPDRPARIQHRGGRLWVFNSCALDKLAVGEIEDAASLGFEKKDGAFTGRLYEGDEWLGQQLNSQMPNLHSASHLLASFGITGITDTSPRNSAKQWQYFIDAQQRGELLQSVRLMGTRELEDCSNTARVQCGEYKIHLLESQLPGFDQLCAEITSVHAAQRNIAVHCVSLTELVFTLSVLETVGARKGDRIEHASVTPPEQLKQIQSLGLRVVSQSNFIAERGDQYLSDVDFDEQKWLYRSRSFLDANVPLAGGSDAPFGKPDPWFAMHAAISRSTPSGAQMSPQEALSPEQALALFLSKPEAPGQSSKCVEVGQTADLCLLDKPWQFVRQTLDKKHCRLTLCGGEIVFQR